MNTKYWNIMSWICGFLACCGLGALVGYGFVMLYLANGGK